MKYKFKAKDLKTGEWVEGDLAYVKPIVFKKGKGAEYREEKPMIVKLMCHGGMLYATSRYLIDESTIELIEEE